MKSILFALGLYAGVLLGAEGKVIKVLPHFVDFQGRHTLSPSLYERDAYQELLRNHPEKRAGLQFEVLWKVSSRVSGPLRLKMELRGGDSGSLETLEMDVKRGFFGRRWSRMVLDAKQFARVRTVTAWKATLLQGEEIVAESNSFLW
jgi:hypothetical protein